MPAIWYDDFNKANGRLLLTKDLKNQKYIGDFDTGTSATNDTVSPFILHITNNKLVLEQTGVAGFDMELRAADFIFDMDVNTIINGIPLILSWRISTDKLSFFEIQLKNTVGSRPFVFVNGSAIYSPGNILPQINNGDKIQVRMQGNTMNMLWNGVVGWTFTAQQSQLLNGTLFQLLHTSGPTSLNGYLITDFDNYLPSFDTYTAPDSNGNILIYDVNWNLVTIQFIKSSLQSYPQLKFTDSNPISNIRNCPMIGDGDTIRVLADNGKQPGYNASRFKYEANSGKNKVLVDIRNNNATLFTVNRLPLWQNN